MLPYLTTHFGNPSSIYSYGRETRLAVENARKSVAKTLGVHPAEIFFTSGGTESTNTAINAAVRDLGCTRIITSPLEHHATMHCTEALSKRGEVRLEKVAILENGHVDLEDLKNKLSGSAEKTLITLMHANNEIGNMLDVEAVGTLAEQYGAIFHCDTVQTVGHYPLDLKKLKVHFTSAAGHKFHGPKGIGVLYVNENIKIHPFIEGGAQERNMRAGTENIYGIVGFAKALELAMAHYEQERSHIQAIKDHMIKRLESEFEQVRFNGDTRGESLYSVLSVSFPETEKTEMLLFNLDIHNICVSGGSACSSGASVGSHVMQALYPTEHLVPVRFSFSKYNTLEEADLVIDQLKKLL
jgi:cysteine desulfurase